MKNKVLLWAASTLVAALYVYSIVTSVGNIMGVREISLVLASGLSTAGIIWAIMQLIIPVCVFILALMITFEKPLTKKLLVLAAGLALVSVWQINFQHFIAISTLIA